MSSAAWAHRFLARFGPNQPATHHGLQLAAAVLIGYLVAMAFGLPERFWVVITVLIVMRPDSGSTLQAGLERMRGTLLGVLCALPGVYLQHLGANALPVTLCTVSLLAFASAALPMLRGAAVVALIILGAGELAAYSATQVALLRVLQIGIGATVSVAIALASSRYHASPRVHAGCAALLRRLSQRMRVPDARARQSETQVENAGVKLRSALSGLAALAGSADGKWRRSPLQAEALDARHHRRIVALTGQVVQDTVMLKRVLSILRVQRDQRLAHEVASTTSLALAGVAAMLATPATPSTLNRAELGALRQLVEICCSDSADAGAGMVAAPLRLLLDDLQQLCLCVGGAAPAPEICTQDT